MIYGCYGKQAFNTYTEVDRAIRRIRKYQKKDAGDVQPYRCSYCPAWHIGSRLPKTRKDRK